MGNNDIIEMLSEQIVLHQEIIKDMSNLIESFSEDAELSEDVYKKYHSLNTKIQNNSFSILCSLKMVSLGEVNIVEAMKKAQAHLYWSARPGRYLDPNTGESIEKQYGLVLSSFVGTIAEWNNNLVDYIEDAIQRITRQDSSEGSAFVSSKVFMALRISPLYIGINNKNLKGRIGNIYIYLDEGLSNDIVVISNEDTSAIVTVMDLI